MTTVEPFEQWVLQGGELIELPGAVLYYRQEFVEDSSVIFENLIATVAWQQQRLRIYGREQLTPRLAAWYGDAGARYRYSGLTLEPLPWLPPLQQLRERLQTALAAEFNSVLLNWYRDGSDGMGLHADDEPELGERPVIAAVTLGAERPLVFRPRDRRLRPLRIALADGSLLVMAGECQRHWRHELPKIRRPLAGRISLTYRQIRAL
jgi:alkylated DNA repair dioxygenase AlkB